jgi:hypothetical protein
MSVDIVAAAKAERLQLLAGIARYECKLSAVDELIRVYTHFEDIDPALPVPSFLESKSLPDMQQPAQTEADHPSGDNGDHAAGVALAPAAPIPPSPPETTPPAKTSSAEREGDDSSAPIPEAPTPLPEDSASAVSHFATPAEAKSSDQEPSHGSGEVQDECAIHLPAHTREESRERQPIRSDVCAEIIRQHPDWTAQQIAEVAGESTQYVNVVAASRNLTVRRLTAEEKAELARKSAKPDSRAARLRAYLAEHPDAIAAEASKALNINPKAIYSVAVAAGVSFPKAVPAPHPTQETQAAERAPTPTPAPAPVVAASPEAVDDGAESYRRKYGEPQKQPFDVGDPDAEGEVDPEPAAVYRLMSPSGQWLHRDMTRMTYKVSDAWQGTAQNMERLFAGNPRLKAYEAMKA